jgi:hypothetical protein
MGKAGQTVRLSRFLPCLFLLRKYPAFPFYAKMGSLVVILPSVHAFLKKAET